ncbi:Type I restriction-modification system, specificity subunit S [Methanosarcina siciliae T4/M]|uniref:Type I restriction-modification system, specificity subunit S n=1 Tax=Methanosarcina siciliae T4/M TaxID=1434120 RepID=A0A0E3P2R8_9EURY|nr:restriction endonuclease subunit S [Methanosarcina siciliae]AKB27763.1 Type I restriction-modification system, specificity subunit S [Methanosarcina siciliae T4/M]
MTQKFKETEIGKIPEDWGLLTLEKAMESIIDYRGKTPKKTDSGVPLITAKIVKNGRILEPNEFISPEDYESWMRRGLPKPGDVVITTEAPMGEVAQLDERKVALAQRLITLRGKQGILHNNFLRFVLQSPTVENELKKRESGTTVTGIKQKELRKTLLPIPPYDEQIKISEILMSLDDKIELNIKMNSALEQIAQTLFKHWFIDFEFPDKNGNPYKSSGGRMVDSELGEIPEGWRVGNILDFANLLSGGTPKTSVSEYWDGGIPWVSAKDVTSSNGTFILTTEKTITQKGIERSNAKLLPKYTTVVTARGTVGNVCILSGEMAINQTNYGLKSKYDYGDFFLFLIILNLIQDMKQNAYGTVFDTITTKTFRQIQIIVPSMNFIELFENIVGNLMHKMLSNLEEFQNLSAIRDSLLPKLISGKIRVQ